MQAAYDFAGFFYYVPWVLWAAPLCLAVGFYFLPLLSRVPQPFAIGFFASGAIFAGGAVGLETLGGHFMAEYGVSSWQYTFEFITEEGCESAGLALFVVTVLKYWRAMRPDIRMRLFSNADQP